MRLAAPTYAEFPSARPFQPRLAQSLVLLLFGMLLLASSTAARAQNDYWQLGADGLWDVGSNWSAGIPTGAYNAFDTVGYVITHNSGNDTVNSFTSAGSLLISGGSLNVLSTISVQNTFALQGGQLYNGTILSTSAALSVNGNGNNLIAGVTDNSGFNVGSGFCYAEGSDGLNGTSTFGGGNFELYNSNGAANVAVGGTLQGYGLINEGNGGGNTLAVSGFIDANSTGNTLSVAVDNLSLTGTLQATNGGIFSLTGGKITGNGGVIDTSDGTGLVQDNGGAITGTFTGLGSAGITFTGSGNNLFIGATLGGNITMPTGGHAYAEGTDALNGTSNFTGGNLQLYNSNGAANVAVGGELHGHGLVNEGNGGGNTLNVTGSINADTNGQTLAVAVDNLSLSGTIRATNGGTFSLNGGTLNGSNGTIDTTDATGTVQDNGGVISGTLTGTGAAGISFTSSAGNLIYGATIGGNITLAGSGFTYAENTDALNGTSNFVGGNLQLYNNNGAANVTVGGELHGYGLINQGNGGGNTLYVTGSINADSSGNTLAVVIDDLYVTSTGTIRATSGGIFSLTGGTMTGNNGIIDTSDASGVVEDNGGYVTGTFTGMGAAGITFVGNGNNHLVGATFGGNITLPLGGFTYAQGIDALNGTSNFSGGNLQLNNSNGAAYVTVGGELHGFGLINENNGGGNTLAVTGSINADSLNNTLAVAVDDLYLTGTIRATTGGIFSLTGGTMTGSNGVIDTTDITGTVQDNGGYVTGTYTGVGAAGITFVNNGNNHITNATIGGDITLPANGFSYAQGIDALNGTSNFSGGNLQLNNSNGAANVTVGGELHGFGLINENNGGGNTLAVTGSINADSLGNTLSVGVDDLYLTGTIRATSGGTFSLVGGTMTGNNGNIDTTDVTGTVQDNGGYVTGTFTGIGAAGITFVNNGNNHITNATIGGDITLPANGFSYAQGMDALNGTSNFSGGNLQLNNSNGAANVTVGGELHGFGLINENNGGGNTLNVTGSINADSSGNTLGVGVDYLTLSGTIRATSGGIFSLNGGTLIGSNGTIDTTDASGTVQDNGGVISGTLMGSGAAGISFTSNGNNLIYGATIGGNITLAGSGFTYAENTDALNGTSNFAGGNLRLYNNNGAANVTVGGELHGYGLINQGNGGGNTLAVTGSINADSSGNTLAVGVDDLYLTGTIRATSGGIFSLVGGAMTGGSGIIDTSDATGVVQDNGGYITGTFTGVGAAGITFVGNGNNVIANATFGGNISLPSGGFTYAEGTDNLNGTSSFTGGNLELYNSNGGANVIVGGLLHGYGTINQGNGGNTLSTSSTGTIQADGGTSGPLNIGVDSVVNGGTLQAIDNSVLNVSTNNTPTSSGLIYAAAGSSVTFNLSVNQTGGSTVSDGTVQLNGGSGTLNVTAGNVSGSGTVKGSVTNAGTLQPGDATPGTLTITANYVQTSAGTMNIRLNGHTPGYTYDVLDVGGNVNLTGALDIYLAAGPHPFLGDTFDIVDYTGHETGVFSSIVSENPLYGYSINYGTGLNSVIRLTVTASPVPGPDSVAVFVMGLVGGATLLRRRVVGGRCLATS